MIGTQVATALNINLPTRDEVSKRFRESPLSGRYRRNMTARVRKCGVAVTTAVVYFGGSTVARAQDDGPAVVPYRPSVATPADLPAPGWPELEAGLSWAKGGDIARSQSSPVTFKLAWNESWAVLI